MRQSISLPNTVALFLQIIGAIQLVTPQVGDPDFKKKTDRGKLIAQIGVIVQLACFGLFSVIAIRFHFTSRQFASSFERRIHLEDYQSSDRKNSKYVTMDGFEGKIKKNWAALLRVTNIASVCILVRTVRKIQVISLMLPGSVNLSSDRVYWRKKRLSV